MRSFSEVFSRSFNRNILKLFLKKEKMKTETQNATEA